MSTDSAYPTYRGYSISDLTREAIQAWIGFGIRPGSFLQAVLRNDLHAAIGHADDQSLRALPAIVNYVYQNAPSDCWGSPEKVKAWAARFAKVQR